MVKFVFSLLIAVFLSATSGVAMSAHYCMGELVQVAWGGTDALDSCCDSEEGDGGCCADEFQLFKLSVDLEHTAPPALAPQGLSSLDCLPLPSTIAVEALPLHPRRAILGKAPPDITPRGICTHYCQYRI